MQVEEIKPLVHKYFENLQVKVSETALRDITNTRYIDVEALEHLSEDEVMQGLTPVLEWAHKRYQARTKRSKTESAMLRDVDMRAPVRRSKCSQPPFYICKKAEEAVEGGENAEENSEGAES